MYIQRTDHITLSGNVARELPKVLEFYRSIGADILTEKDELMRTYTIHATYKALDCGEDFDAFARFEKGEL